MSRTRRDAAGREAFGQRLQRVIDQELGTTHTEMARALGYHDSSTIRAAVSGRCGLDADRLVLLAKWSRSLGKPINLHWLLTGEASPQLPPDNQGPADSLTGWLTPARHQAFTVIADSLRHVLKRPG